VPHVSKKPRLQQHHEGEEKSVATSRGWGENSVRESLTDLLVGSAMCAPVHSNALARRQVLVKRTQVRKLRPQLTRARIMVPFDGKVISPKTTIHSNTLTM
jgi:hypothetical protein